MKKNKHCNIFNTYTFYFNVLFYILLFLFNKGLLKGFSYHIIPFVITSSYIVWYRKTYRFCTKTNPPMGSIIADILGHWMIFFIFLYLIGAKKLRNTKSNPIGFILPILLFFIYFYATNYDKYIYGNVNITEIMMLYISMVLFNILFLRRFVYKECF